MKPGDPEKTTDLSQITDKLYGKVNGMKGKAKTSTVFRYTNLI
jgi:hypothetical protein